MVLITPVKVIEIPPAVRHVKAGQDFTIDGVHFVQ
jgi:hypothetical protein